MACTRKWKRNGHSNTAPASLRNWWNLRFWLQKPQIAKIWQCDYGILAWHFIHHCKWIEYDCISLKDTNPVRHSGTGRAQLKVVMFSELETNSQDEFYIHCYNLMSKTLVDIPCLIYTIKIRISWSIWAFGSRCFFVLFRGKLVVQSICFACHGRPLRSPNLRRRWRAPWWGAKGETAHHPHGPKDVAPSKIRCPKSMHWLDHPTQPLQESQSSLSMESARAWWRKGSTKSNWKRKNKSHIHDTTEIHILASFVAAKSTAQGTEDKQSRTAGRLCSILQVQRTSETIRS